MPKISYVQPDGTTQVLDVAVGMSVMQGAKENGVEGIEADCGGVCACATCHVYVDPNWMAVVGKPGGDEIEMLDCATDPRENSRLSCQIAVTQELDGLVVNLPATQR